MKKISVIIPILNKKEYLSEALDSVVNQTLNNSEIEILCIDYGSTDESEDIVKNYQEQYDNITLVQQENKGLSFAINTGMDIATGKYIAFLDADDMLKENTLGILSEFFDEVYHETDIIAYTIKYTCGKEAQIYPQDINLEKNCIIDITKNANFPQTTMNICVKGNTDIRFHSELEAYEEQLFCTMHVINKNSIGWCSTASYIYRKNILKNTQINLHMTLAYNDYMFFINKLLSMHSEDTESYIFSLILYDINWRIKENMLFPYGEEKKYNDFSNFLVYILDTINNESILNNIWLSTEHKNYLLSLKSKNKPFPVFENNKMSLSDDTGQLLEQDSCLLVVQRERLINDNFYMMGFLKSNILSFTEKPRLFAYINDKKIELNLYDSIHSHCGSNIQTQKYYGFEYDFKITHGIKIRFEIQFLDYFYPVDLHFSPNNVLFSGQKVLIHPSNNFTLQIKEQKLLFFSNDLEGKKLRKTYFKELNINKKSYFLRKVSQFLYAKRKIFLYIDRKGTYDNAYYQFKHDVQQNDNIDKYYITFEKNKINEKFSQSEKPFVVSWNSLKHKLLLLSCEKVLTSNAEPSVFIPFVWNLHSFMDILKFETVYLQHGVMHADVSLHYAKDKLVFVDKIAVSTEFEKNTMLEELHYQKKDVLTTGMPRYSAIKKSNISKRIAFVPSWRKYLLKNAGPAQWIKKEYIDNELYISEILNFLNSQKLHYFLANNNIILDVKLHSNFENIRNEFVTEHKNVQFCSEINIGDYDLAISDISSIMYDFAFLNIPILRFIPDMDMVLMGYHSYHKFFFDIFENKDLFSKNSEELLQEIEKIHSNNYAVNYDRARIGFFENCTTATENIYKALV